MKLIKVGWVVIAAVLLLGSACGRDAIDDLKPVIDLSFAEAFPRNCDTLYFGESFTFAALFTDNVELGSYSIEIHQNFDHHAHSTEVTSCSFAEKKEPVNPFHYIQDFTIPNNSQSYNVAQFINIPHSNQSGEFDEGDYHFFVSLTDKEGWSTQMGLSIKMLYR